MRTGIVAGIEVGGLRMDPHRLVDLPAILHLRSSILDLLFSFRLIELLRTESFGALPALALFGFLRGNLPRSVLDGNNTVGLSFAKAPAITLFDEDRKRSFPTFLLVVVQ
jgi:hypothetical protein